jgi:hypothetical protein
MKRVLWLLVLGTFAACRDEPRHASGDWKEPHECHDAAESHQYCIVPSLRLVTPFERGNAPSILVSGGADRVTELDWEDSALAARSVFEVGAVAFNDLDRMLRCDVDGDGELDVIFSQIDGLTRAAIIWGDPSQHVDSVQRIDVVERLQGTRCLDVDGDGHADLFGMLDETHFGVLYGETAGFFRAPVKIDASLSDEIIGLSTIAVVETSGALVVAKIRYQQSRLDVWRVGVETGIAAYEGARELAGQEAWLIDASRVADGETAGVVVTGPRAEGGAAILVFPGDSDELLSADPLVLERTDRPLHIHDVDADADGDIELLVVGPTHDGVYLVDVANGELEVVEYLAPVPVVDAALLDLDLDGSMDLAMIRGDLDQLELVFDAVAL